MMPSYVVRPAGPSDLASVVVLHQQAFPGFFLTSLGPPFLRELYRGLMVLEEGILLVAESAGGHVVGFVGGTDDGRMFYRQLLRRRGWRFALAAAPAVVRHPSITRRVVRGRERADASNRDEGASERVARGSLMSLGVAPHTRASGAGRALVRAFEQELRTRGCAGYTLTTDAEGNDRVNAFYRGLGLVPVSENVTPEGRRLVEYAQTWTGPVADSKD